MVLRDVVARKNVGKLSGHKGVPRSVAFDPSGRSLAVGSFRMVKVWDIAQQEERLEFAAHSDRVYGVVFSADGRTLATGSLDGSVKLWDVPAWSERLALKTPEAGVLAVALSADGELLAAGCDDHRIVLWDARTGERLALLAGHSGPVVSLTVRLRAGGKLQVRDIASASENSSPLACFGLGREQRVERLEIRWPSGVVQKLTDLAADQRLTVRESAGSPGAKKP